MGTVHKAKGLEFDTVMVTDDFTKVPCSRHNLRYNRDFSLGMFLWINLFTLHCGVLVRVSGHVHVKLHLLTTLALGVSCSLVKSWE